MKFRYLLFLWLLLLSKEAMLSAQDTLLIEALRKHSYQLYLQGNEFAGDAAPVLREAMKGKQFLLVGEQHGIVEVGQFTRVLFKESKPFGFNYFCIETDPFIAQKLEALTRSGLAALQTFNREFPLSIPFYNNQEDFSLLEAAIQQAEDKGPVFWGVDQVFAAAPRYLFQRLTEIAPTEEARKLAATYLKNGQEGFKVVMETGDFTKMLLMQLKTEDFDLLFAAFGKKEGIESTQIITGLIKTKEIYDAWYAGKYYQNNLIRSRLMKKQFMTYYQAAAKKDPFPKVIFKFGSTHTYRGLSYYQMFDLGNLVSELAAMNETESLHIHFSGIKGQSNTGLQGTAAFDHKDGIAEPILAAMGDKIEGEDWILIDMRPIREKFGRKTLEPIKSEVFNYDFWIFVPNATPVTTLK
ncbi:MAG: hypothetical protein R2828_04370 [Saprospiraceae bacterium]